MKREKVTKEQIRILNQLGWDRKVYANFTGDNQHWLECNFYLGERGYKYRVDCNTYDEVEQLRKQLELV